MYGTSHGKYYHRVDIFLEDVCIKREGESIGWGVSSQGLQAAWEKGGTAEVWGLSQHTLKGIVHNFFIFGQDSYFG